MKDNTDSVAAELQFVDVIYSSVGFSGSGGGEIDVGEKVVGEICRVETHAGIVRLGYGGEVVRIFDVRNGWTEVKGGKYHRY